MVIDPRRLEALVAVHRTGSVSAAAAELHYGQPTISHHLRRLEAETGSVLVQRVGRGVRLTDDGLRLARRGEEILGLLARAGDELAAATSLQAGRVRLAAFPSAAATLVPAAISLLAVEAPGLTWSSSRPSRPRRPTSCAAAPSTSRSRSATRTWGRPSTRGSSRFASSTTRSCSSCLPTPLPDAAATGCATMPRAVG